MDEFHKRLTALRRDFHRDPELGFQEERTKAKVAGILRDLGLEVHEGAGVVGILKAGVGNRAACRYGCAADSRDQFPPGVMHACGHDGHTTMFLGATETLSKAPDFDGVDAITVRSFVR